MNQERTFANRRTARMIKHESVATGTVRDEHEGHPLGMCSGWAQYMKAAFYAYTSEGQAARLHVRACMCE